MADTKASFLKGTGMSEPKTLAKIVGVSVSSMAAVLMQPGGDAEGERFLGVQRLRLDRLKSALGERFAGNDAFDEFVENLEDHLAILEGNLKGRQLYSAFSPMFEMAAGVSMSVLYHYLKAAEAEYNIRDEPEVAAA